MVFSSCWLHRIVVDSGWCMVLTLAPGHLSRIISLGTCSPLGGKRRYETFNKRRMFAVWSILMGISCSCLMMFDVWFRNNIRPSISQGSKDSMWSFMWANLRESRKKSLDEGEERTHVFFEKQKNNGMCMFSSPKLIQVVSILYNKLTEVGPQKPEPYW